MKLLLVDNLILPERGLLATLDVHPHLGLLALAAVAEGSGHKVSIFDPKWRIRTGQLVYDQTLYERAAAELLELEPEVVGFTTLGCSFLFVLNVSLHLKRRKPDLPILLGGPHATMLHDKILTRFAQIDVIARHECDEILPALLDALPSRRFRNIPGLSWREGRRVCSTEGRPKVEDLDSLPMLNYDHYPVNKLHLSLMRIEAGRGCPFACTFCSTAGFFQRSFRLKSATRLVKEMDVLHERYGVQEFKLDHDMFTVNKQKVSEFCQAVRGRQYHWRASARVDCVNERLLGEMADAGCTHLYFGIETGSARMQKISAKRLDLSIVPSILRATEQAGIATTASFITGYPEESQEDQNATLDLLAGITGLRRLTQLHLLAPEPGTPLFEQYGNRLAYDGYNGPYNTELLSNDDREWVRSNPDLFATYHYYPSTLAREQHVFIARAVETLQYLGPLLLTYMLRTTGGRLSTFLQQWRDYHSVSKEVAHPDSAGLVSFISRRHGASHHLVSLIRYALCVTELSGMDGQLAPHKSRPLKRSKRYRLGDHVRVLVDLHDCGLVLERIRQTPNEGGLLDESQFATRLCYVVVRSGPATRVWTIEAGLAAILSVFQSPHLCTEVVQWLRMLTGRNELDDSFLSVLVREGVLVPASHGKSG